jgi:predicted transcriptional regulator
MNSSSSTLNNLVLSSESTTKEKVHVTVPRTRIPRRANKSIENAIYAHIQAIRSLGRTAINTAEIAEALSLPVSTVNRAISALKKKGVKVMNG